MKVIRMLCLLGLFLWQATLVGQETHKPVDLLLPQNIFIPGEEVWFGVLMDNTFSNPDHRPIFNLSLHTSSGKILWNKSIRMDSTVFISSFYLGDDIDGGTYILSLDVYDALVERVLINRTECLHVLTKDALAYYSFPSQVASDKIRQDGINFHTRDTICLSFSADQTMVAYVVDNLFSRYRSGTSFVEKAITNPLSELTFPFKLTEGVNLPGIFDLNQKVVYQVRQSQGQTGLCTMIDFYGEQFFQPVDWTTGLMSEGLVVAYPDDKWDFHSLTKINIPQAELDSIRIKAENRETINRIYGRTVVEYPVQALRTEDLKADVKYDLTAYVPFETLELFIQENVGGIKINTKGPKPTVRVLSGDTKMWFLEDPLLLINGKIHKDPADMLNIPYKEVEKILIFKKLSTSRDLFGPLGRNGVIEIITKPTYIVPNPDMIRLEGLMKEKLFIIPKDFDTSPFLNVIQYFNSSHTRVDCFTHGDNLGSFVVEQWFVHSTQWEKQKTAIYQVKE